MIIEGIRLERSDDRRRSSGSGNFRIVDEYPKLGVSGWRRQGRAVQLDDEEDEARPGDLPGGGRTSAAAKPGERAVDVRSGS
jgi:hypothetical protein